ncbi:MAG: FAD:protein FMN transferase [Clostridia bacterium]|nr:FAD:protein FMN transferase [Clostridia bacterium]
MKRSTAVIVMLAVLATSLVAVIIALGMGGGRVKTQNKIFYTYFDTVSVIYDYSEMPREEFLELSRKLEDKLEYYHQLFDIYNEYPGINNLCTVNKCAGATVKVPGEIIELLLYGKQIHALTGGECNIAMGAVTRLWHDARLDGGYIPTKAQLQAAAAHTDINNLIIDETASTVMLSDAQMRLDVGALAKGYATELLAEYAEELLCKSLVLDIGGNIRTVGELNGGGWEIKIKNPDTSSENRYAATLTDIKGSVVTSGNYERVFEYNGASYHHIIDKDTLMPADYFASVTVITEHSGLADALSTALFCMPIDMGEALAKSIGGVRVIWVSESGEIIQELDGE